MNFYYNTHVSKIDRCDPENVTGWELSSVETMFYNLFYRVQRRAGHYFHFTAGDIMDRKTALCRTSRRRFLKHTGGIAGGLAAGAISAEMLMVPFRAKNVFARSASDRPLIAAVGVGGMGSGDIAYAARFGDPVAICDVDLDRAEAVAAGFERDGKRPRVFQDHRRMLDACPEIEVVVQATPDHWHTPVVLDCLDAGKDMYTEKPLCLTIAEGKMLRDAVARTGRIVQVGTQQRSDSNFRRAVELVRNGRIGKLQKVLVVLPFWDTTGGPFPAQPVPPRLDWDRYQGQAPVHDYCPERSHFLFRWWSDYAGGIITDWGQHHMDIAYWGMNCQTGPQWVEGSATFPNQGRPDCYDNPDRFVIRMGFPDDVELLYFVAFDEKMRQSLTTEEESQLFATAQKDELIEGNRNGIMFIGSEGRIFVNRGGAYGRAVQELAENPLPEDRIRLYESDDHMGNFFECVKSRAEPISTVATAHRVITACHLGNVAIRTDRRIRWDAAHEEIVGDPEAAESKYVHRPQREPYGMKR